MLHYCQLFVCRLGFVCSPPRFAAFGEWEIVDRMVWRPGLDSSQSLVDSRSSTTPSGQRIFVVYTLYLGCFRVALYLPAEIGYRTWGTEQDVICPDCAVAFLPCTLNPQCFVSRGIHFRLGNRCTPSRGELPFSSDEHNNSSRSSLYTSMQCISR